MPLFHLHRTADFERSPQVFHAFAPVETSLRRGVSNPLERIPHRFSGHRRDQFCKHFGLIKFPLPPADVVERHGHQSIERLHNHALILQRLRQPACECVTKERAPQIFEAVNKLPDRSGAEVARNRAVEVEFALLAIRTDKYLRDRAVERRRTFCAPRFPDALHLFRACLTEMASGRGGQPANCAMRWKAERQQTAAEPSSETPCRTHRFNGRVRRATHGSGGCLRRNFRSGSFRPAHARDSLEAQGRATESPHQERA